MDAAACDSTCSPPRRKRKKAEQATTPPIQRGATFSGCANFRYLLQRSWASSSSDATSTTTSATRSTGMLFIGLNPSTADAERDDPTMRRCMDFARQWGHESLRVVNLFALRSPQPLALKEAEDPIGNPENDAAILEAARACERILCGWGSWDFSVKGTTTVTATATATATASTRKKTRDRAVEQRAQAVLHLLQADGHADKLCCLQVLLAGQPKHPLYVRADQQPVPYSSHHYEQAAREAAERPALRDEDVAAKRKRARQEAKAGEHEN